MNIFRQKRLILLFVINYLKSLLHSDAKHGDFSPLEEVVVVVSELLA
jgi:hypothetical protein